MRFIARTKKIGVTIRIQTKLVTIENWMFPNARDLVMFTAFVSGRKICAII